MKKEDFIIALDETGEILLEFKEGSILSMNDLSLLRLYINRVKEFAKTEYERGHEEGISEREQDSKGDVNIKLTRNTIHYLSVVAHDLSEACMTRDADIAAAIEVFVSQSKIKD